jgi:hypothetical protein
VSNDISNFFGVVSQISFTIAGFVLLVVAGDRETRKFWYGKQSLAAVVNLHLILLVFPGFIGLTSLISPENAWPLVTCVNGLIILWIRWIAVESSQKLDVYAAFEKADIDVVDGRQLARLFGVLLVIVGISGFFAQWKSGALIALQILLIGYLFIGVPAVVLLLRAYEACSGHLEINPPASKVLQPNIWNRILKKLNSFLTAIVFIIGIIVFGYLALQGTNPAELFVQTVGLIVVTITLIVYYKQLLAMGEQSKITASGIEAQNLIALTNFLQSDEIRKARNSVLARDPARWNDTWVGDERSNASKVCSSYGVAGVILQTITLPKRPFLENWGPSIIKSHVILQPLIEEMRKPENGGPSYWTGFDWLFRETLKEVPSLQKHLDDILDQKNGALTDAQINARPKDK